jgi:cytochrome c oxidase cbb3-type subunit III
MKFRNYLETISGVSIFPLISLVIFFVFFVVLLWYVIKMDRKKIDILSNMPLDDGILRKGVLSVLAFLVIPMAQAQGTSAASTPNESFTMGILVSLLGLVILTLVVLLVQVVIILQRVSGNQRTTTQLASGEPASEVSWWTRFSGFSVTLSEEKKILIADHDYDGIHELDNRMPPWLQFLFIGTIAFAFVYVFYYHFTDFGNLQQAELDNELAVAEVQKKAYLEKVGASIDENTVTLLTEEGVLKEGSVIYMEKCAACHAADGGGTVGPNLADNYWLHGGSVQSVFKTIKYGVPEKGMISWEKQLSPTDIQKVTSFVISLKGTTPASPREPQGEPYVEETATPEKSVALK